MYQDSLGRAGSLALSGCYFYYKEQRAQGQGHGGLSLCPIYIPQGHVLVSLLHQRILVIEGLALTDQLMESWIKWHSLRFTDSFSGPKTLHAGVLALLKLKLPQETTLSKVYPVKRDARSVNQPPSRMLSTSEINRHFFLGMRRKTSSLKSNLETCCSLHFNSVYNGDIETIMVQPQQVVTQLVVRTNACLLETILFCIIAVTYSDSARFSHFLSDRKSWWMMLADWQPFIIVHSLQVRCREDHPQRPSCRIKRPSDTRALPSRESY